MRRKKDIIPSHCCLIRTHRLMRHKLKLKQAFSASALTSPQCLHGSTEVGGSVAQLSFILFLSGEKQRHTVTRLASPLLG